MTHKTSLNQTSPRTQDLAALYDRMPSFLMDAQSVAQKGRQAFRTIRNTSGAVRNNALLHLAMLLDSADERKKITLANERDLEAGRADGLSEALLDRLHLNSERLNTLSHSVREIAAFPDPVGEVVSGSRLPNGIHMEKRRVPLGVIYTIFESRPNVTVDVGALCLKSGNSAILRGGKEAIHTNMALYGVFTRALREKNLPVDALQLVSNVDRAYMLALLQLDDLIDLVVPRGGHQLIQFVTNNSRIPVVKHDKGVCNLFIDKSAPLDRAIGIALNAKLQRPSVCNAIENLVIHGEFQKSAELLSGLEKAGVNLLGCNRTLSIFPGAAQIENSDDEYSTEYLDNRLSVKIVDSTEEALDFIHHYGSGHSEAIVSEDQSSINTFVEGVDSSAVFVNCSTRFNDGGEMGMGAEVGISTQRLHVRGPMGVRDLTTTTYVMTGNGQVRR